MKKILSCGIILSMLLSSGYALAEETQNTSSDITMLYNNEVLASEEFVPFIHENRTMLPFRFLLEEIGAVVNYDEATRTVSATKDDISIGFSLDDTYIDITKDGSTERVVQDVKNVLKNNRVYIPIRFMSEAFDLSVGWDAEKRTAIVVDFGRYVETLSKESPDLIRYLELSTQYPESYSQAINLTLDYNSNNGNEMRLDFTTVSDLSVNGDGVVTQNLADIDTNMLNEKLGAKLPPLDDVSLTVAYKDGYFYIKTDAVERLKAAAPDNDKVKSIAFFVNSNTWFKADFDGLCTELGISSEIKKSMKSILIGSEKFDLAAMCNATASKGLDSVSDAVAIDLAFSISGKIFNNAITITDNGNGNYDMRFIFPESNLVENKEGYLSEEELTALKELFTEFICAVNAETTLTNNIVSASKADYKLSADGPELTCKFSADTVFTPDTAKEVPVPTSAIDIVSILKFLG